MDKEDIVAFLRENLKIEIETEYEEGDRSVSVKLKLCGETISETDSVIINR